MQYYLIGVTTMTMEYFSASIQVFYMYVLLNQEHSYIHYSYWYSLIMKELSNIVCGILIIIHVSALPAYPPYSCV